MPIEVAENTQQGGERRGGKRPPLVPIPADAPKRPDYKELKVELDKIFEQISGYREEIQRLKGEADKRRDQKDGPREEKRKEKTALVDEKAVLGKEISQLRADRDAAMKKVRESREKAKGDVAEIRKLNKELGELLTPEDIDKKIKELEFKLETGAVSSIKGEKKIMLQIKDLKANRDKAASMKAKVDSVTNDQKQEEDFAMQHKKIQRKIDEKSIEFKSLLGKIEEKSAEIAALSNMGEAKKARDERDAISQKITDSYAKVDAMKENFEKKKKAYEEWQVEYDKLCQAERERRRKEREERDRQEAERQKEKELEIASLKRLNPYEEEINACRSLIGYLKSKVAFAAKDERKSEAKPAFDPTKNVAAGFSVMKKAEDGDDWLMGGKKKKKTDKPKAAPKPKEPAAPAKAKPVKHSHEKFEAFAKLKIKVPNNTDEVKEAIAALEEKAKHYESFKKTEKEALAEEKAEREQKKIEEAAAAAVKAAEEEAAEDEE